MRSSFKRVTVSKTPSAKARRSWASPFVVRFRSIQGQSRTVNAGTGCSRIEWGDGHASANVSPRLAPMPLPLLRLITRPRDLLFFHFDKRRSRRSSDSTASQRPARAAIWVALMSSSLALVFGVYAGAWRRLLMFAAASTSHSSRRGTPMSMTSEQNNQATNVLNVPLACILRITCEQSPSTVAAFARARRDIVVRPTCQKQPPESIGTACPRMCVRMQLMCGRSASLVR